MRLHFSRLTSLYLNYTTFQRLVKPKFLGNRTLLIWRIGVYLTAAGRQRPSSDRLWPFPADSGAGDRGRHLKRGRTYRMCLAIPCPLFLVSFVFAIGRISPEADLCGFVVSSVLLSHLRSARPFGLRASDFVLFFR